MSLFIGYPTLLTGNFGRTALSAVLGQKTPGANLVVALFISIVLVGRG